MPRSSDEMPELGKTVIIGYDQDNLSYPILGIHNEPRGGYIEDALGAAHPDTAKWPSHKLVSIKPTQWDSRILWTYRILPSPRVDSLSYPYGDKGKRVTSRTEIIRSSYTTRTANGTAHPIYTDALLVDEKLEGIEGNDYLATLVQIYDDVPVASDQQGLGYFVAWPWGDTAFPQLTWRFKERVGNQTAATFNGACPITGFTTLQLTGQKDEPFDELGLEVVAVRIYEILPGKTLSGPVQPGSGTAGTVTTQRVVTGTSTDTGPDVIGSSVEPENAAVSVKKTETGALWINATGLVRGPFGIPGTITDAVVDKTAAAISAGIDIESSTSAPEDKLRNRQRTETISYSTATITLADKNERGDDATLVTTFPPPNAALPGETHLIDVKRTVETLDRARQTVETAAANSTLTDKLYEHSAFGAQVTKAEDIVDPASASLPALDLSTWDSFIQQTKKKKARKVVVSIVGSLPTLTEYDQDPDYQSLITTTREFAANPVSAPSAVAGVLTRYIPHNDEKWRSIKIVRTRANPGGSNGALANTLYVPGQYTFPTLLYGITSAGLVTSPVSGRQTLYWNPNIIRARSRRVTFKVQEYFYNSLPTPDAEFNPIGADYIYNGVTFNVDIPQAICDGGFQLQYSDSGIVETFSFGASPTTLTVYLTKVGVWTIITSKVTFWHDGLFLKTNTSLKFQE